MKTVICRHNDRTVNCFSFSVITSPFWFVWFWAIIMLLSTVRLHDYVVLCEKMIIMIILHKQCIMMHTLAMWIMMTNVKLSKKHCPSMMHCRNKLQVEPSSYCVVTLHVNEWICIRVVHRFVDQYEMPQWQQRCLRSIDCRLRWCVRHSIPRASSCKGL